ncbi:bacteriocin-like protein [Chryseobacterium polytrichastri]
MKNLKKVSRNQLRTIKGGYKSCIEGCSLEIGEICCTGKCRIAIEYQDPNDPEFTLVKCP